MADPTDITSMAELRQEIDALDRQIVASLKQRAALIDRAIQLKQIERLPARISHRVEEVVENVRAQARGHQIDPDLIEDLWRRLIEWSIMREEAVLGQAGIAD